MTDTTQATTGASTPTWPRDRNLTDKALEGMLQTIYVPPSEQNASDEWQRKLFDLLDISEIDQKNFQTFITALPKGNDTCRLDNRIYFIVQRLSGQLDDCLGAILVADAGKIKAELKHWVEEGTASFQEFNEFIEAVWERINLEGLPPGWLSTLFKDDGARQVMISKHIPWGDKNLQTPVRLFLIIIYRRLTGEMDKTLGPLSAGDRALILAKLLEAYELCSEGYLNRISGIVQSFSRPRNLQELLAGVRERLVQKAASQVSRQLAHGYNEVFKVANSAGFGVRIPGGHDIYSDGISRDTAIKHLEAMFTQEFRAYHLPLLMVDELRGIFCTMGYEGNKGEVGYTAEVYERILAYLEQVLDDTTLSIHDVFIVGDADRVVDICWPFLITKLHEALIKQEIIVKNPLPESLLDYGCFFYLNQENDSIQLMRSSVGLGLVVELTANGTPCSQLLSQVALIKPIFPEFYRELLASLRLCSSTLELAVSPVNWSLDPSLNGALSVWTDMWLDEGASLEGKMGFIRKLRAWLESAHSNKAIVYILARPGLTALFGITDLVKYTFGFISKSVYKDGESGLAGVLRFLSEHKEKVEWSKVYKLLNKLVPFQSISSDYRDCWISTPLLRVAAELNPVAFDLILNFILDNKEKLGAKNIRELLGLHRNKTLFESRIFSYGFKGGSASLRSLIQLSKSLLEFCPPKSGQASLKVRERFENNFLLLIVEKTSNTKDKTLFADAINLLKRAYPDYARALIHQLLHLKASQIPEIELLNKFVAKLAQDTTALEGFIQLLESIDPASIRVFFTTKLFKNERTIFSHLCRNTAALRSLFDWITREMEKPEKDRASGLTWECILEAFSCVDSTGFAFSHSVLVSKDSFELFIHFLEKHEAAIGRENIRDKLLLAKTQISRSHLLLLAVRKQSETFFYLLEYFVHEATPGKLLQPNEIIQLLGEFDSLGCSVLYSAVYAMAAAELSIILKFLEDHAESITWKVISAMFCSMANNYSNILLRSFANRDTEVAITLINFLDTHYDKIDVEAIRHIVLGKAGNALSPVNYWICSAQPERVRESFFKFIQKHQLSIGRQTIINILKQLQDSKTLTNELRCSLGKIQRLNDFFGVIGKVLGAEERAVWYREIVIDKVLYHKAASAEIKATVTQFCRNNAISTSLDRGSRRSIFAKVPPPNAGNADLLVGESWGSTSYSNMRN